VSLLNDHSLNKTNFEKLECDSMKRCPQCGFKQTEKALTACRNCGFVLEKRPSKRPRLFTIILVPVAVILLTAYLTSPQKLAYWVRHPVETTIGFVEGILDDIRPSQKGSQDLYGAFLGRHRVKPDERLIKAFDIAATLLRKYRGISETKATLSLGEAHQEGQTIVIPVIQDNKPITTIQINQETAFQDVLVSLVQFLRILDGKTRSLSADPLQGSYEVGQFKSVLNQFYMVDSRRIVEGLLDLERLWRTGKRDPRFLLAGARGYALLSISLYPDEMQYGDDFMSYALGFLALLKHLNPGIDSFREEAFIAMNMGYTGHAEKVLNIQGDRLAQPEDEILDAYMKKDFSALEKLKGDGSRILSHYFLSRLYRESGLLREAEAVAKELLTRFPDHYPSVVEAIYSADLGIAKILTLLYPLDILTQMEAMISKETLKSRGMWDGRVKAFSGDPSKGSETSFRHFENKLSQWKPLREEEQDGFFVDEHRLKTLYKTLYSGAISLRFSLLLNRYNEVEKAQNFANSLSEGDETYPLAMYMNAVVQYELGNREVSQAISEKIMGDPKIGASLSMKAYRLLDDYQKYLRWAPVVSRKQDSRPENLAYMGSMSQTIYNYDIAADFYSRVLMADPFNFPVYKSLSAVTGNHEPIERALKQFPENFIFLEEAGDYFSGKKDDSLKERALTCYGKAMELAPSRDHLWRRKATVLKDLCRYAQSAELLTAWIDRHGRNDLTALIFKAELANRYLDMKKPEMALEILSDQVESYQGGVMMTLAGAYEALGRTNDAEKIYVKAVRRYPTNVPFISAAAAFMWRQERWIDAADLVMSGRKLNNQFSRWYFDDYMKVFSHVDEEKIMESYNQIVKKGAGIWERIALAFRFQEEKRPEIAYRIMAGTYPSSHMERLENLVSIYTILRNWKGAEEAKKMMTPYMSPQLNGPLSMVLFKKGMFDLLLDGITNPDGYPEDHREFMWLMKLMAWQATDRPLRYQDELTRHYDKISSDDYHAIGRYMMGYIDRPALFSLMKNAKKRCEFSYYIGFTERMKGNFPEAANWYQLCLETELQNNGEYHFASDELFFWAHMGTKNRHRNIADDIKAYHE
jgi:tetratricopeptide (TPR) repeat protein/uncharacterized protein (DUF983 family)